MTELIEAPEVESIEPPPIVVAPAVAAAVLESASADGDRVTLSFMLTPAAREPLTIIQGGLLAALDRWRDSSAEWPALRKVEGLISSTKEQIASATADAERCRAVWLRAIGEDDPGDAETAYTQARLRLEVLQERHAAQCELCSERRVAADRAWQTARAAFLSGLTATVNQRAEAARAALALAFGDGATLAAFAETIAVATAMRLRGAQINSMASRP